MKQLVWALLLIAVSLRADNKKAEAENFYREYLASLSRLRMSMRSTPDGWLEAGKKISAASALDPSNLEYYHTNMYHQVCQVYNQELTNTEKINLYQNFLQQAKILRSTWPDYQNSSCKSLFHHPQIRVWPFEGQRFLHDFSAAERADLIGVFAELRILSANEKAELRANVNQAKRFKNRMEMIFFTGAVNEPLRLVIDNRSSFQASFDAEMEFLKICANSSPDLGYEHNISPKCFPYTVDKNSTTDFTATLELLQTLLASRGYQQLLRDIKLPKFDLRLLEIQALQDYTASDLSPESLKKTCSEYFRKLEFSTGNQADHSFIVNYTNCLGEVSDWILTNTASKQQFRRIAEQALLERGADGSSLSDKEFLLAFRQQLMSRKVTIADPLSELRSRAASLGQLKNHLLLRGNPLDIAYTTVADALYNTVSESAQSTIETLFPAFTIRFYPYPRPYQYSLYSCGNSENIYILLEQDFFCFSTVRQQFMPLAKLPSFFEYRQFIYDDSGYCIALSSDCIAVYDLALDQWSMISDLSGDEIAGAAIVEKRLFYLHGGKQSPSHIALNSCDLQGNKRKLHFSSRRGGGIVQFQGITSGVTSELIKNTNTKLIFTMVLQKQHQGGIFVFDIESDTLGTMQKLPRMASMAPQLQKLPDGSLFGSAFFLQYFRLQEKQLETFLKFSPHPETATRDWARHTLFMNDKRLIPCALTPESLLISPRNQLLINLEKPEATPFIWLPRSEIVVLIEPRKFALPVPAGIYTFTIKK